MSRNSERPVTIPEERLYRTLIRVALPIAAQGLIGSSLNLVDNLMVGSLGETALSAVGLSSQIFFVHWMVLYGFTSGTATYTAQFWGKRDLYNIRRVIGVAFTICLSASLIFFLPAFFCPELILRIFTNIPQVMELGRDYIRVAAICFLSVSITVPFTSALKATQQTSIPLKISIIVFLSNTLLNYIFIFGNFGAPALGVAGAALATAIARMLEVLLVLFVVFGRKNLLAGKPADYFSWTRVLLFRIAGNSLPTTINETMWGLGAAMYNAAYGRIGVTEFAAVQAGGTIQNLFTMACFSLGDAALIIIGERLGRGELDRAEDIAKKLLKTCVLVGITAGALLFFSSRFIVRLFDFSPEGVRYTQIILGIYSLFLVIKICNAAIITGVLRAGGDTRYAMLAEVGCVWLIGVPLAFLGALRLKLPVYFVVLLVQSEELIKLFLTAIRFRSKKWVRNLVAHL